LALPMTSAATYFGSRGHVISQKSQLNGARTLSNALRR